MKKLVRFIRKKIDLKASDEHFLILNHKKVSENHQNGIKSILYSAHLMIVKKSKQIEIPIFFIKKSRQSKQNYIKNDIHVICGVGCAEGEPDFTKKSHLDTIKLLNEHNLNAIYVENKIIKLVHDL